MELGVKMLNVRRDPIFSCPFFPAGTSHFPADSHRLSDPMYALWRAALTVTCQRWLICEHADKKRLRAAPGVCLVGELNTKVKTHQGRDRAEMHTSRHRNKLIDHPAVA